MNSAAIAAIVDRELALNAQDRDPKNLQLNIVYNGIKEGLKYLAEISQGELEFFETNPHYPNALGEMGLRSPLTDVTFFEGNDIMDRAWRGKGRSFSASFIFMDDGTFGDGGRLRYAAAPAASRVGRLMNILRMKPEFNPEAEIEKALVSITRQAESRLYVAGLNRPKQSDELKPAAAA